MSAQNQCSITLFFPMHNELKYVEDITRKALHVMEQVADDFEILIIDDGSTDGSEMVADSLALSNPSIRVIHHQGNKGYGQALRTGFSSARKEVIAYTDCDEPLDLWRIRDALPYLHNHDLVLGYRINRWEGAVRYIYSNVYNLLVRTLFGVRVRDINFSFKIIRREALQKLRLGAESVFIDGELLAEAVRHDLRICEIPIKYLPRRHGASHFNSIRAAAHTLKDIWTYWRRKREETICTREPLAKLEPGCRGGGDRDT